VPKKRKIFNQKKGKKERGVFAAGFKTTPSSPRANSSTATATLTAEIMTRFVPGELWFRVPKRYGT